MINWSLLHIQVLRKSIFICYIGHSEETFCLNQHPLSEVLGTIWIAPSLEDLIENIGLALLIPDLPPIGMAHQFEQQCDAYYT